MRTTWIGTATRDSYYLAKANVFRSGARSLVTTPEVVATLERARRDRRSRRRCGSSTPARSHARRASR